MKTNPALSALRHHVTGAIARGEAQAITEVPDNARLIAAAPTLLEALESIMEWTDIPAEQTPIERRELLIRNAARAAIAKARG